MRSETASLDDCATAPIHAPGSIQPHGVLLVIDAATGLILQASSNAPLLFRASMGSILGAPWRTFVRCAADPESLTRTGAAAVQIAHARVLFPTAHALPARYSAVWHLQAERWFLEIEAESPSRGDESFFTVRDVVREIEDAESVTAAAALAASALHRHLGYDHVLVYRFAGDFSGEVIAESLAGDMLPYLGLRYPASDIPAQARAIYLHTRVRTIANIAYTPAPLIPALDPKTQQPVDLSSVGLRSVAPIHVEYVKNMGIAATLVFSVIIDGSLWGLVACHHRAPHAPSHGDRDFGEVVSRAFASTAGALERRSVVAIESQLLGARERLLASLDGTADSSARYLAAHGDELLAMADADGVALLDNNSVNSLGSVPHASTLLRLRRYLVRNAGGGMVKNVDGVLHTDSMPAAFGEFSGSFGLTDGMLCVALDSKSNSMIAWFRDHASQSIRWGGNPYLASMKTAPGVRVSPRHSFQDWLEAVRGRCRAWEPRYLESARMLALLFTLKHRVHEPAHGSMLSTVLNKLREPMIIFAVDADARHAAIVHVNDAFATIAGVHNAELIEVQWRLNEEGTSLQLKSLLPFRVTRRISDDELVPGAVLEMQPLGMEDGRQLWMGLFQTLSTDRPGFGDATDLMRSERKITTH